ncbi:MAG: GNAT family N-acetyltransferase [bacterium]
MEYQLSKDNYTISTKKSKLNIESVVLLLAQTYWASERTKKIINLSIKNSLCFGLYDGEKQIGFARVVTDYAIFAYLCDVIIAEEYRGKGLGKWLVESIMLHPQLQGLKRWLLATRDAHGLYKQFGWRKVDPPENWMEIFNLGNNNP